MGAPHPHPRSPQLFFQPGPPGRPGSACPLPPRHFHRNPRTEVQRRGPRTGGQAPGSRVREGGGWPDGPSPARSRGRHRPAPPGGPELRGQRREAPASPTPPPPRAARQACGSGFPFFALRRLGRDPRGGGGHSPYYRWRRCFGQSLV